MGEVPADSSLRADARRNRARVLAAAQELFAAEGLSVPLSEIAARAGVGAGTVYRHFPTKEALFEAVVVDRLDWLLQETRTLADAEDPGEAFYRLFRVAVERASLNHALCAALAQEGPFVPSPGITSEFRSMLGTLLVRAQRAGAVRDDLDMADVSGLMSGCVAMEQQCAEGRAGRMISVVFDALRPGGHAALPPMPAVTKQEPSRHCGHETELVVEHRDETTAHAGSRCAVCGEPLHPSGTGRPVKYCGATCRQRAHRERRTATNGAVRGR